MAREFTELDQFEIMVKNPNIGEQEIRKAFVHLLVLHDFNESTVVWAKELLRKYRPALLAKARQEVHEDSQKGQLPKITYN